MSVTITKGSKTAQHEGSDAITVINMGEPSLARRFVPHKPTEPEKLEEFPTVHPETDDGWLLEQRELLRVSLPDIAFRTRTALDDAALAVEVYFTVPVSGNALINFATLTDPSDPDWAQANQIVCNTIANITGIEGLRSRALSPATSDIP